MNYRTKEQNEQIGALVKEFVSLAVDFYNHLDTYSVSRSVSEETLESLRSQTIPMVGRPLQEVYTEMIQKIYANTLLAQHPRSFSCIPSTASLLSWKRN